MTGVNINKIRRYAPGFNSRTTRLDADVAALIFKAGNSVISQSEMLVANISVKAAMPTSPDTDGKKRGPENTKSNKYKNLYGVVYDPTATKKEGQYFKHYVTESERIEALRSPDPVPNWGWLDYDAPTNSLPKPRNAVAKITRYPVNPKTGEPMKSQGFEPEIKALGKTIGERNPAAKLSSRAASAMGLVIDALGKFRCPPGTFAANRFTNERGEGCFGVSAEQMQDIAGALTNALQAPNDRITLINSLMAVGVTAAAIRKEYKERGLEGLASIASRMGISGPLVGEKGNDASYMSTAVAKIRERLKATKNAPARMDAVREKKNRVIQELRDKYGITEPDEYLALGQIFRAMSEDPDAPFGPGQFEKLFMGGSPGSHEEWVVEETIKMHMRAIAAKTGITDPDKVIEAYYEAKTVTGEITPLTRFIDAAIEREKKFRIGAFKQILVDASENPETFKTENGNPFEIYVDMSLTGRKDFTTLNGVGRPTDIYIGSGPAIKGFRDAPGPGYMDLYEATGGDIDDQWRAITESLDEDEKMRRWGSTFATDLAAESGNGWEDFGAQTAAHEITHKKQFDAIFEWFRVSYPGEDFNSASNDELMLTIRGFIENASDENIAQVFGISFDELIERRFDALAGVYSQVEQQNALAELRTGDPQAFNAARNLAFLETHAELNANRSVGLIGDDPELDEVLDSFILGPEDRDVLPPTPSGIIIPGTTPDYDGDLIIPGAPPIPGGELIIPGRRPDVPVDAPKPVKPKRPIAPGTLVTPTLPEGAGTIIPSSTPQQRTPRTPRGPVDMFERERNGKVPRMIREERFTNQDIEEHMYGEDGKSGLFGLFRSAKNMRIRKGSGGGRDMQKKKLLNDLIDTMGVSFEELEAMSRKIQNGEKLSPEERQKLTAAITHLRNGANEFKRKAEEAREKYRNYRGVDTSDDYRDKDSNYIALENIQEEIEMYEKLFARVGRGFAPAVHDILTMDDNGPYPDRLGGYTVKPGTYMRDLSVVRDSQDSVLSNIEIMAIEDVSSEPPLPHLRRGLAPELEQEIANLVEMASSFSRHGLTPPAGSNNVSNDIDRALPAMQGIDKTSLPEDIVVEIEIDLDSDGAVEPGSVYEVSSIQTGKIELNETNQGLASVFRADSTGGRVGAGAVSRLIGSRTGRKLIEKIGVDPEQADLVQLVSEIAIGFSAGGPAGALVPLARRGGRDVADKALEIMVERGWIEQGVADKITKYGLNRIAAEGLPDEILKAAEVTKDKLLTEESKRRALEIGSSLQERSLELTEAAREKATELTDAAKEQASELAERAKEQTSEIIGRMGDRWKRRRDRDSSSELLEDDPFASPPDPSTGAYPLSSPPDSPSTSGLASTSSSYSTSESREYLVNSVEGFKPSKVKTENPIDAGSLYDGGALLETTSYEIGGKKVIFGNPKDFEGQGIDAEIIPLNPFEISGLSKDSEEGQKAAIDWYFARVASTEQARDVRGTNHVEALLYAASKGDGNAKNQLEELSRRGKELTEAKKRELARTYTDEKKAEIASKFQAGRLPTSEDLVAVRQISFPPKFDDEGNLLLENASDYDVAVKFEEDGSESKERYKPFRKSVHFTINAPIEAHPLWKPGEDDYIIVIDFAKMLEANPGSIDNLLVEDTFLTGKPGEPLKIPKGFFTYEKIKGKDRGQIVRDGMDTLGKGKEFIFEIGTGGEGTGTREHMADALDIISQEELNIERGVLHQQHSLHIEKFMDSFTQVTTGVKPADEGINRLPDFPSTAGTASGISLNSILALADNLNWSDAELSAAIKSIV
jgi:hypothetical protein